MNLLSLLEQLKQEISIKNLVNLALFYLEQDEIYCQLGSKFAENLISEHSQEISAYLIEPDLDIELEELADYPEWVNFFQQSTEEFFSDLRNYQSETKIGLYISQGSADYRLQLLGLQLTRPFLAKQAVIIADGGHYSSVRQAVNDFLLLNPEASLEYFNHKELYYLIAWDSQQYKQANYSEIKENNLLLKISQIENEIIESLYNKAQEYHLNGEIIKAQESYWQAINLNPKIAPSWFNLALLYSQNGQVQEALNMLIKSIELNPNESLYHYQLGLIWQKLKRTDLAIEAYKNSLTLQTNLSEVYNQLGNLYYQIGDIEQAEIIYREGNKIAPNFVSILINLGNTLLVQGKIAEAISHYQRANALTPERKEITENLKIAEYCLKSSTEATKYRANYFYQRKVFEQAIAGYEILIKQDQADSVIYKRLGQCYEAIKKEQQADKIYRAGLAKYPKDFNLNFLLISNLQKNIGDIEGAIQAAQIAINNNPDNLKLKFENQRLLPLIYQTSEEIDIYRSRFTRELEKLTEAIKLDNIEEKISAKEALGHHTNFFLAYQGLNDLELQTQYGELIHKIMQANYPHYIYQDNYKTNNQKIKVGYISAYIYSHSVTKYSLGWLKHHNRTKFEIYGYHVESVQDIITEQFKQYCDYFYHIPLNLEIVAEQILADQLDILVYLDLGMHPLPLQLAGLKLAPIQCMGWGHPVTSGLPTIDYYISSSLMEPTNAQEHYREKLVLLSNLGMVLSHPQLTEKNKTRDDFGLAQEKIIYLCSQSLWKYLPQYDDVWPQIAKVVSNAHFVFFSHHGQGVTLEFQNRLERVFGKFELNWQDYCKFYSSLPYEQYLEFISQCDIFLDSFAWSGGITSIEATFCSLVLVSSPGEMMRGRQAYALLKRLNIDETIAENSAEYVKIAARLGLDRQWRESIQEKMRQNKELIFEDLSPIADLESFYENTYNKKHGKLS